MAVTIEPLHNHQLHRIFLQSIKLPLCYLFVGTCFLALSLIDHLATSIYWKKIFDLTDKLGDIFVAFALITFVYNVLFLLCQKFETQLASKHAISSMILTSLRNGLRIIFILIMIKIILIISSPSSFYQMIVNSIINVIIIGSIGWLLIQIVYTVEAVLYQRMVTLAHSDHTRIKTLYTKMHILRNITAVVIVIVTVAAILMSFNSVRNIGISLLASAGFLTALISLSGQKTFFAIFSGLQIAFSQTIKIGDIVVMDNVSGIIEEITFTYVTLKLGDRRRLIVPINFFVEKSFENWSREADSLRSSMQFYIDYMLPVDPLRNELENILKYSKYWDGKAGKIQVSNITEQSVELRIQISAANADNLSELRAEVREKMLNFIREKYPSHFPQVRFGHQNPTKL